MTFFKISQIHEKATVSECRFEKTAVGRLIKKTPTQVFSYDFCKFLRTPISENNLLQMAAY